MARTLKTEEILETLIKMRIEQNASYKTILDYLKDEYGFKQSYRYTLLQKARKKIQQIYHKDIEEHFEEAKGQLEKMLETATGKGDARLMLQIRQELNKLIGLYNEKIDITSGGEKITEIKLIQVKKD